MSSYQQSLTPTTTTATTNQVETTTTVVSSSSVQQQQQSERDNHSSNKNNTGRTKKRWQFLRRLVRTNKKNKPTLLSKEGRATETTALLSKTDSRDTMTDIQLKDTARESESSSTAQQQQQQEVPETAHLVDDTALSPTTTHQLQNNNHSFQWCIWIQSFHITPQLAPLSWMGINFFCFLASVALLIRILWVYDDIEEIVNDNDDDKNQEISKHQAAIWYFVYTFGTTLIWCVEWCFNFIDYYIAKCREPLPPVLTTPELEEGGRHEVEPTTNDMTSTDPTTKSSPTGFWALVIEGVLALFLV